MTAISIFGRIRAAGGDIRLADEGIRLKVPASLHGEAIAEITAQKNAIRRALKNETDDPWDAEDYCTFHDERTGIAELEGGLSGQRAKAQAYEGCIVEWLNRHHEPSDPGHCAWCGMQDPTGHTVVPFGADGRSHTWLHPECWRSGTKTGGKGRRQHYRRWASPQARVQNDLHHALDLQHRS